MGYGICSTRMKFGVLAHSCSFNSREAEEEDVELEAGLRVIERKKK